MDDIKQRIRSGKYILKDVFGTKGYKSDLWHCFKRVFDEDGKTPLDFVVCNVCSNVLSYVSKDGTSGMKRHKCVTCSTQPDGTPKIDTQFAVTRVNLSQSKKAFTTACVRFVAKDLRPYSVVSGDGFRQLVQAAIDIGAAKGKILAESITPDRTTVASNCRQLAKDEREKLIKRLSETVECCGVTADMWTDDFRRISYLTLTIHYLDNSWQLQEHVLSTRKFDDRHTGVNIRSEAQKVLDQLGLQSCNIVFVTDRGSNMIAAFRQDNRLSCKAHLLNNALDYVFEEDPRKNSYHGQLQMVFKILKACRELVTYVKNSNGKVRLETTLKQVVKTRWNSHLYMLRSIDENFDTLNEALMDSGEYHRITVIDRMLVKSLINFLAPFKEVTDILEASNRPTIHRIIPQLRSLLNGLITNVTDSGFLGAMKAAAREYLEANMEIDKLHRIALFLNPKMRSLKALIYDHERTETYNDILAMISCYESEEPMIVESPPTYTVEHAYSSTDPSTKRFKTNYEDLWEDDNVSIETSRVSSSAEIEAYKNVPVPKEDEFDLLKWWAMHTAQFPRLSRLAKRILCIPASSAPSERNFSTAGNVVTKQRTRLSPRNVDDMLFLHSILT